MSVVYFSHGVFIYTVTGFNEASEDFSCIRELGVLLSFFCCCLLHFGFSQLFSAALPYGGKCQMYGSRLRRSVAS